MVRQWGSRGLQADREADGNKNDGEGLSGRQWQGAGCGKDTQCPGGNGRGLQERVAGHSRRFRRAWGICEGAAEGLTLPAMG